MKARQLISGASYGPEALKTIFHAFDDAWDSIAANFGTDSAVVEAARLELANVILSFPDNETRNAGQIKNSALQIMALTYKKSRSTGASG